jgi:hypothetical protein
VRVVVLTLARSCGRPYLMNQGLSRSPLRTSDAEAGDNEMPSYNDRLKRDRNFINPYAVEHMVSAFSLQERGTMFKQPPYPHLLLRTVIHSSSCLCSCLTHCCVSCV